MQEKKQHTRIWLHSVAICAAVVFTAFVRIASFQPSSVGLKFLTPCSGAHTKYVCAVH